MNEVEIWVSFNYGAWSLVFSKNFKLPFTPFFGLQLTEETSDGKQNEIIFENTDYCNTNIDYNITEDKFYIDIRNVWKFAVSDETIDYTIDIFTKTNWYRHDNTDIKELKELMRRN